MEKAIVFSCDCNWKQFKWCLGYVFSNDNLKEFLLEDFKPSQWGVINNKLVKIDYGTNQLK